MIEEYITSWVMDQQVVAHMSSWSSTFFKNFYFEIIMDSLEAAKIVQRQTVYFTQIIPMITSSITTVKYHNKDSNLVQLLSTGL